MFNYKALTAREITFQDKNNQENEYCLKKEVYKHMSHAFFNA